MFKIEDDILSAVRNSPFHMDALKAVRILGIDDLLSYTCHATPYAKNKPSKLHDYRERMLQKKWWELWPKVQVLDME